MLKIAVFVLICVVAEAKGEIRKNVMLKIRMLYKIVKITMNQKHLFRHQLLSETTLLLTK